jgi:hypothetical protein
MLIPISDRGKKAIASRAELRKQQQQQQQAENILAEKSITIKNTQDDVPNSSIQQIFQNYYQQEYTTPKIVAALGQIYTNTTVSLNNKSVEELVHMINLATFLDMKKVATTNNILEPQEALKKSLMDKIKSEKIAELQSLNDLNSNKATELMHDFIKEEKIDVKLLEPYQKKLPSESITPLKSEPNCTPELLFFNDDKFIYGLFYKDLYDPKLNYFKKIISKNRKTQKEEIIFEEKTTPNVTDSLLKNISTNTSGSFCILEYITIGPGDLATKLWNKTSTFKLFNVDTKEITVIPAMNTQYQGLVHQSPMNVHWCFASDDTVCFIDTEKNIQLLYLKTNQQTALTQLNLTGNVQKIACRITDQNNPEDAKVVIIIKKNDKDMPDIFIVDKLTVKPVNCDLLNNIKPEQLIIDNSKKTAYIAGSVKRKGFVFSININSPRPHLNKISINPSDSLIYNASNLIVSTENKLLTTTFTYPLYRTDGEYVYSQPIYFFTVQNTLNSWHRLNSENSNIIKISSDGKQAIEQHRGILYNTINLTTFYDDNMINSLNYLDTTKPDSNSIPAQKKLLVTKLLYLLLNKPAGLFNTITLDQTESEMYVNDVPQCIKNILAKTYTINLHGQTTKISTQEQPTQSSLRNKFLYGTAAIGTAIGATAAYKWWTGNNK